MIIGGLQKFSLLDYPEHLSAIIFTQGCNFRCQFCYNPMLVRFAGKINHNIPSPKSEDQRGHTYIKEDDLFSFLKKRLGKLDAVVITGGEPTIHADLPKFIKKIKSLGYKIKLDTNGAQPEILKKLVEEQLIDYLAMDIKASEKKYKLVTGEQPDLAKIKKSIKIIKESGLPYEFRTTIVPGLHEKNDIKEIGKLIKGGAKWFLQQFKSDMDLINKKLKRTKPYTEKEIKEMCKEARKYVKFCEVR